MLENSQCNVLCNSKIPGPDAGGASGDGAFINELIEESYNMNWLIDGLPAATVRTDSQTDEKFYSVGFELGSMDNSGTPILNNHYDIIVEYHVSPPPVYPCTFYFLSQNWELIVDRCAR
jgi:transmembrane 9 superfamily protein 2/4